jgi:hypothetical protein
MVANSERRLKRMYRRNIAAFAMLALTILSCAPGTTRRDSGDEDQLLLLHEEAMRAHRESNIDLLLEAEEDDYIVSSRGEVSHPDRDARRQFLGPYLESTRFSVYRDQIPPVVKVSRDGSLGWVVVQVEAKGEQTEPDGTVVPLEFVSSWISLYEKRSGRWVRIGNVSNFKLGPDS